MLRTYRWETKNNLPRVPIGKSSTGNYICEGALFCDAQCRHRTLHKCLLRCDIVPCPIYTFRAKDHGVVCIDIDPLHKKPKRK